MGATAARLWDEYGTDGTDRKDGHMGQRPVALNLSHAPISPIGHILQVSLDARNEASK